MAGGPGGLAMSDGRRRRRSRPRSCAGASSSRPSAPASRGESRTGSARCARRRWRASRSSGFPTTRHEDWRHTSVAALARTDVPAPAGQRRAVADVAVLDALDFGHAFARPPARLRERPLRARLSPSGAAADGVRSAACARSSTASPQLVQPYLDRQASGAGRPFAALNTAFLDDGAFVFVPARHGARRSRSTSSSCPTPGARPTVSHPRILVVAGRGSQAALVESYGGPPTATSTSPTRSPRSSLEDGAVVDHYRLQRESDRRLPRRRTLAVTPGPRQPLLVARRLAGRRAQPRRHPPGLRRRRRRVRA